ncbi:MAG: DUF4249 domain-containing protein [Cytophagales bacterium]|nr:DUF4249 domain-containing protein [Cytophagales bacterium]MDW8383848.1 DUF4249 domain-containing protein [Flammeovirgaceae bacterium]
MKRYFYVLLLFLIWITACEDKVDLNIKPGESQIVIDAWVTIEPGTKQVITLSRTTPYLENNPLPLVRGAFVQITNQTSGRTFNFSESYSGAYVYQLNPNDSLGSIGDRFMLSVQVEGETYQAFSQANRVPSFNDDSIFVESRPQEFGNPPGLFVDFNVRDLPGIGDFYFMRTYYNGKLRALPQDLIVISDITIFGRNFDPRQDGLPFIFPIRSTVNRPLCTDGCNDRPYKVGDTITLEILSITSEAFDFWTQVQTQATNVGLLASPPSNVPTNIQNVNPNGKKAVGFFTVSAVVRAGVRIKEENLIIIR